MADNDYDPAGSTQMFRAFVDETPAPQAPGSVNTYGSSSNRTGVIAATMGIAIMYLLSWVLSMFGVAMTFLHDSSPLSIGISLLVVGIAALNLILDFDLIERGVAHGAPRFMEWYASFGLLVTLVWLYLELLRLLAKLQGRGRD